jgi:hypothetical protein
VKGKGLEAIKILKEKFKDSLITSDNLNDLRREYETREIQSNETVTQFINALQSLRRRLGEHNHTIEDDDFKEKILNCMVSEYNFNYLDLWKTLTITNTKIDLITLIHSLKRIDAKILGLPKLPKSQQESMIPVPTSIPTLANPSTSVSLTDESAHSAHYRSEKGGKKSRPRTTSQEKQFKRRRDAMYQVWRSIPYRR